MSYFIRRCHIGDMMKKTSKIPGVFPILRRNLITQETPGVYSFGPNFTSNDANERQSNETVIFKELTTEMPSNSYYERPTPIIFISGEALSADIWFSTANYFSLRGFSGILISLPDDCDMKDIDIAADYLEKKRTDFGLTPPVMVAHSVSSFIAQKYLESYSLKGLVLVNPIPPVHTETIRKLIDRKKCCDIKMEKKEKTSENTYSENEENRLLSSFAKSYYNIDNPIDINFGSHVHPASSFPISFMEYLLNDETAVLRLEKGVVPLLVVSTIGDKIGDFSPPILTEITLNSIADFHGFDKDHMVVLESDSRAPMLAVESSNKLSKIMYDWIDDL